VIDVINLRTLPVVAVTTVLAAATPLSAQRVLELPVRTGAGADALVTGPAALFWNPASIGVPTGIGEALVLDTRGPAPTGLDGLAFSAAYRLNARTSLSAGLRHSGIEDVERTTTSPLPTGGAIAIDISETTFLVGAMREVGTRSAVGAGIRYTRVSEIVGGDDVVAIGGGGRHTFAERSGLTPVVAAGAWIDDDGADWFAAAAVGRHFGAESEWGVGAEWGVRGSPRFRGIGHRFAVTGSANERLRVGLGLAIEQGADGRTVEPAGAVSLSIARYVIGVVREELPNDFGAVHQFRLSITF
jgi:hypothetical protein